MTLTARIANRIDSPRRGEAARKRPTVRTYVVRVLFDRPDGAVWTAIGGGVDLAAAIADARTGLPGGRWQLAGYEDVYGD